MPEEQREAATTVRELGIEFAGFQRLVEEKFNTTNQNIERLTEALEATVSDKASKRDVEMIEKRVAKIETTIEKIKSRIVGAAITIFVGMVLALYGLDKFFK